VNKPMTETLYFTTVLHPEPSSAYALPSKKDSLKEWLNDVMCASVLRTGQGAHINRYTTEKDDENWRMIIRLIESGAKGPEVTRGFVVNSARAMGAAPDALAMVLEEAGVKVKEEKSEQ
jgi:hypothetical protein